MPTPAASSASASAAHRAADRAGRLPGALAGLSGWRRSSTALALGALLAAALPPFHLLAAAAIAFTFWAWLLNGARRARRAFLDGWCFGAGFSAAAFYWIANALLVDAARFGWLYPVALAAIAAGFGLFPAAAALAAQRAPAGAPRTLALAIAWLAAEWLRSWLFTGFPWNLAGTAFAFSDALIQPAAWGGPWLLTALLLAAALAPALAQRAGRLRPAAALKGLLASVAIVAAAWAAGTARLAAHPVAQDAGGTVLRLVQPAIAQRQKGDPALEEAHFAAHAALTLARPPAPAPTVVIWPEAAVPWGLMRDQATPARLAALAPPQGALLAGAVTVGRGEDGRRWARNSLLAVAGDGAIAFYHKHRLVPFGEYVPLRGLLPIDRIVPGVADFAPGPGPATMAPAGLPPFAPLICYGGDLRRRRPGRAAAPGMACQYHQRRLVRPFQRPLAALPGRPPARRGTGAAHGARRQQRHQRRHRPAGARAGAPAAGPSRRAGRAAAGAPGNGAALCRHRREGAARHPAARLRRPGLELAAAAAPVRPCAPRPPARREGK